MCATEKDHTEIVKILLDNGANVNAKALGPLGTPLDVASTPEIKQILKAHGAKTTEELKS